MSRRSRTRKRTPASSRAKQIERAADWISRAALVAIALKLTLVVLLFDPLGEHVFAVPKAAASRGLGYVVFALTAVQLVRKRGVGIPRPLLWSAGAYLIVFCVSTILAVHPYTAAFGARGRLMGLTQVLDGLGLALATVVFVRTIPQVRSVMRVIAVSAALMSAYALVQAVGRDPIPYAEPVITSTVGNPGAVGGFALIVAALMGAMATTDLPSSRFERIGAAAVALLLLLVVVVTGARGPVLAIAVVALTISLLSGRRWLDLGASKGRLATVVAAATLLLAVALVSTPTGARISQLVTGGDLSTSERALIYAATLDAVRQHPLLGVGLDGLVVVYPSVRPPGTSAISGTNVTQSSTHSWFLQQLLGAGAAGALVSLSLVLATFGAAWSLARSGRPAAVIGLAGLAAFLAQGAFNIVHVVTDTFFWLSIGLSAAASAGDQGNASQVRSHRTMLLAGLAAVVGLAAAATVWSSLEANRAVRASNVARVDRDLATAERHAVRATELDPGRADHWNVLGLARTGRPEAAIQAFRRAVEAASYEPVYLLNLAREEARASERTPALKTSAREHAARAVQLDPNSSRTHFAYSQTLALIGDLDAAAAPAERAIVLEPSPDNYDWAALIYADLGRPLDAIARLRSKQALLFPDGKLPLDERLRLGRLHEAVGDIGSARALFAPPTAAGADPNCEPTFGSARLGASLVRPRCIRLVFEIEAPLLADRTTPGTVTDPAAYTIGDEALPRGSTIFYDGRRFVTVQLPADALPPEPRTQIVVRGITDIFGNRITPDPGHLAMQ